MYVLADTEQGCSQKLNGVGNDRKWKWHIHTAKFVHTVYVGVISFISLTEN